MELEKNKKLGKELVLDELFDLALYKRLLAFAGPGEREILAKLVPVETRHLNFWKTFFGIHDPKLNLSRKIKLNVLVVIARIFGKAGIHIVLEAIEIYGIRKYLNVWKNYKDKGLGDAVKNILEDEFGHEDEIVSSAKRTKIYPERVRDIFLGFNDGLVEILGAVSGFFAAFSNTSAVLIASLTVAVAGSISMAASAFASLSSALEVEDMENQKQEFLGNRSDEETKINPTGSAVIVGVFYFFGAMIPVLPVLFGAKNVLTSIIVATLIIIAVSYVVAFLSGMNTRKRIALNLIIIAFAVSATYILATIAKSIFGIAV